MMHFRQWPQFRLLSRTLPTEAQAPASGIPFAEQPCLVNSVVLGPVMNDLEGRTAHERIRERGAPQGRTSRS